ncbi:PRC-barrel domain-containing protein [Nonomuraea guangzhouensis]|uniref:PRC-barrel domain-containing protein n=1 Tax=Nonomuraea guangzhouensis TaxID=1291555 RepID=A0ABW4G9G0_9ACTN|nr:PRC-barrel domain-containing protein [Nonomuraea guangzhouensis]
MQTEIRSLLDSRVLGADGEEIGKVGQVYLSDSTGEPEWVTVRTGLFGVRQTFVPLMNARRSGAEIRVPFDKETIKDAPNIDVDGRLSLAEEARLYRHYGIRASGIPSQRTAEAHIRVEKRHVHLYKYVETEIVQEGMPLERAATEPTPVDYLRSLKGKRRPPEMGRGRREQFDVERVDVERLEAEKERMPLDSGDDLGEHDDHDGHDDLGGFDDRPPLR